MMPESTGVDARVQARVTSISDSPTMSAARTHGPATRPARAALLAGVTVIAAGTGLLAAVQPGAAAALSAVLALAAGLLYSARSLAPPRPLADKRFRWVVCAWVYVMIRPIGHYTTGRTTLSAVNGIPSVENVLDLGLHAAIAMLAVWSMRNNHLGPRRAWLVCALPVLALVSTAWSVATTVTLGFAFELIAISLLAMLTVAICDVDPALGRSLVRRVLRACVVLVAVLAAIGLVFPHSADSAALDNPGDARFTWPGEHPLVATAELGFAFLVILFSTRGELSFGPRVRIALGVLFAVCLYLGSSRTAFAGVLTAALFGAWFVSKGSGWARRLAGFAAIALGIVLIVSVFGGPIGNYLYRGQSHAQVFGLNGRLGLWSFALQQLHTPAQWVFGYGLSATRVFLANSIQWAGDAHGAWIELLLSLGLFGVAVAATVIVALAVRVFRSGPERPLASRVIPILFVYVLAMSPVATGFAAPGPEPGLGFAVLALCYAATAVRSPAPAEAMAARGVRLGPGLTPVSA